MKCWLIQLSWIDWVFLINLFQRLNFRSWWTITWIIADQEEETLPRQLITFLKEIRLRERISTNLQLNLKNQKLRIDWNIIKKLMALQIDSRRKNMRSNLWRRRFLKSQISKLFIISKHRLFRRLIYRSNLGRIIILWRKRRTKLNLNLKIMSFWISWSKIKENLSQPTRLIIINLRNWFLSIKPLIQGFIRIFTRMSIVLKI